MTKVIPMQNKPGSLPLYRRIYKINQEQFAEALGIARTTYSYKERGIYPFTIEEGAKLLALLQEYDQNLTFEDLFLAKQ